MTNIEELTKLLFDFEMEMEIQSELISKYSDEKQIHKKLMEEADNSYKNACCDYKESARQFLIIKNQLKEALKAK